MAKQSLTHVLPSAVIALKTLDRLEIEIQNAPSFEKLDKAARTAAGLQLAFKPVKEVSDRAGEVWVEAECKLAEELAKIPKATGTQGQLKGRNFSGGTKMEPPEKLPTRAELGLDKKRSAKAAKLGAISKKKRGQIIKNLKDQNKPVNPNSVLAQQRKETKIEKVHQVATAAFSANGPFDVVVIDPPWKMQKIDRDVRPNQDAFDYPTMTQDELKAFWPKKMASRIKPDCHLFCWTTQKFLLPALELVQAWGFKYVLLMVWRKSGGFQPIGLPQYNCEFIIYARCGSPVFIDTKDFNCCFDAPRREHSRKPDKFYDVVRRVTGGSRIDVFSREAREGFAQYGNETAKFSEAAE